jgi:uncharacterized tellurite resistance protein B-like protein
MEERLVTALLLAKVLAADGMMAAAEKARLAEVMAKLDLNDAERERVLTFDGMDEAITSAKGLSHEKRLAIVDGLVSAALVDGKLSPHELAEVKAISEALEV